MESRRATKRELKKDRRCQCVEVAPPATNRPSHFLHRAARGCGRESLIHQLDRKIRSPRQFARDAAHFGSTRRILAFFVERQPDDEALRF